VHGQLVDAGNVNGELRAGMQLDAVERGSESQ
jgi:hypothetical protein